MSNYKETCWRRLESIIAWSNMSTNQFAHHIGLMRAENLYQIKRGNNGISRKLASMIIETFPEINLLWVLTGEGEMLAAATSDTHLKFYNIDVESNITRVDHIEEDSAIILPLSIKADFAMLYCGDAMSPSIPTNSMVALKRVELDSIIPGKEYVVVSSAMTVLRSLRISPQEPNKIRLIAANSRYDEIVIERDRIERVYQITAKLIIN